MVRMMSAGQSFVTLQEPMPQLVHSEDASNLLYSLAEEELVAYVGVLPYLKRIDKIDGVENSIPFAFGHSLYLDIDHAGGAA